MALRPEMIDFIWLDFIKEVCQLAGVGKVSIMQEEASIRIVRILIEMINPLCMKSARPPHKPMYCIAFVE
jgi:hypothetical protein